MENRLLRNEHDKVIAGVSSGLAAYMEVDVTIIRLLFVLSTVFLVGTGILVYLVMWIVVPVNRDPLARFQKFNDYFRSQRAAGHDARSFSQPDLFSQPNPFSQAGFTPADSPVEEPAGNTAGPVSGGANPQYFKKLPKGNDTGRTIGGLFLLVIGLYFLMNEFHIIPYWFRLSKLWPLVFIFIGLSFILKSKRRDDWKDWQAEEELNRSASTRAEAPPFAGESSVNDPGEAAGPEGIDLHKTAQRHPESPDADALRENQGDQG